MHYINHLVNPTTLRFRHLKRRIESKFHDFVQRLDMDPNFMFLEGRNKVD